MEDVRFPIGKFLIPETITEEQKLKWITVLENFPEKLEILVKDLSDEQLDTPYREKGWTVRQVIHHCADSHHHSYIRFKWAMTENNPTIKAYNEAEWAELFDTKSSPIHISLFHLKAIHAKLVHFLKGLSDIDLERTFYHPESKETVRLRENIGIYAWHCNHHYEHINQLLIRKGWKNFLSLDF